MDQSKLLKQVGESMANRREQRKLVLIRGGAMLAWNVPLWLSVARLWMHPNEVPRPAFVTLLIFAIALLTFSLWRIAVELRKYQ